MAETETIAPSNLLIDAENPRLREPNQGQREALRAIAEDQKRKLVVLAQDIVENRLNPSDLPIVCPHKTDKSKYTILEGNRRIAAIKALESPDTLVGKLDTSLIAQLRKLSVKYLENPIDSILCLVVKNADEAHHWIELRHTGENQGAGIVPWGSEEKSRFAKRSGSMPVEIQVLNFLETGKYLTGEERLKVSATKFRRLLATPKVREKVGITIEKGEVKLTAPKGAAGKALAYVAKDISRDDMATAQIYSVEQRIAYGESLPANIVAKPTLKSSVSLSSDAAVSAKRVTAKKSVRPKLRERLIPGDCVLQITSNRVREIENELRRLKIDDYPNAIAVLFRVFFELSVDDYIHRQNLKPANEKLIVKTLDVVQDLLARKKLVEQQARPVRKACVKNSYLAPSIPVMHEYIHNSWAFPQPGDLRAYWDNLQPFFVAIWTI